MRILLAGGTGLIGSKLVEAGIERGHSFVLLSRTISPARHTTYPKNAEIKKWAPDSSRIDLSEEEIFDAVINLSGENIASGRWTKRKKETLLSSRIESTRCIVEFMQRLKQKPSVFINASATGYYQPMTTGSITEESPAGSQFISHICKEWEREARRAESLEIRCIQARIAVVLSEKGGALQKMLLPFSLGLGGKLGSGKQYMSWISLNDTASALLFCLESNKIKGPVNFCAPKPVTNLEFTKTLGKVLKRPAFFTLPAPILKILLGQMADQLLLSSLPAVPEKLLLSGFEFKDKDLEETLLGVLS
jgi:uncharacterized protein